MGRLQKRFEGVGRRAALHMAGAAAGLAVAGIAAAGGAGPARAQGMRFFRIGTGSASTSYFPIGGLIASAISNPPGSRECEKGGSCGVPGLLAVAQSTQGAVENIAQIGRGTLDSGLAQADVAYWAFNGAGPYAARGAVANLRAVANLYPEMVHIVASARGDIRGVRDLRLRRVSLGEQGSGTLVTARAVLKAFGMSEIDVLPFYLQPGSAADLMVKDGLDAFFVNGGLPVPVVADLARATPVRLLPIPDGQRDALRNEHPFFAERSIAAGTYHEVPASDTLGIGTQLLVSAALDDKLAYGITKALWHPTTQKLFEGAGPLAASIKKETALDGLGVPLHPGAAQYYTEQGMIKGETPVKQP